jgi:hypothetical protein
MLSDIDDHNYCFEVPNRSNSDHNQSVYTIQKPALVEAHNSVLDVQFNLYDVRDVLLLLPIFSSQQESDVLDEQEWANASDMYTISFLLKTSLNCNWEWLGTHALCIKDLKDSSQ